MGNDAVTESAHNHSVRSSKIFKSLILTIGFLYLLVFALIINDHSSKRVNVYVGKSVISAIVASTPLQQAIGLGGTKSLASNDGMLFTFPVSHKYGFWMRNMHYSLDIIWLSSDQQVVTDDQNISPATFPKVFYPSELSRYVLEVNAGTSAKLNIHDGTLINIAAM